MDSVQYYALTPWFGRHQMVHHGASLAQFCIERRTTGGCRTSNGGTGALRRRAGGAMLGVWRMLDAMAHVAHARLAICLPYTTLALVTIRLLRELSDLPVEVWHLPAEAPELQQVAWPRDTRLRQLPAGIPRRRPDIWAVKPLAVLGSDFQEVLLLDADNLPAVDPSFLFDEPQYRATGALFWPDLSPFEEKMPEQWLALSAGHWLSRPCNLRWEQESGQLLVDKDRCAAPIRRAASMALHLRELSAYLPGDGGDKDLFQIAWRLEGVRYLQPLGVCSPNAPARCMGLL
ncbi:2-mannosyltransferase MNN2 (Calcium resistance and vanadate sensitivity protein 4) (Mannan synthesis protein MNN2) [Durusdinium trenchii]|uniref:2-mannosyltransferase MNN2 (Calcium resistance and vanadate sensitivity protein 4) (Mannan synthesis protein MNN2) n=1 Tax=Durusdinium trenchii TaxID=1381693 RepID=A0ABP0KNQ9_9DINO